MVRKKKTLATFYLHFNNLSLFCFSSSFLHFLSPETENRDLFKKTTSTQARTPAEFKHINKRSEKKTTVIPLVTASEQGRAQAFNLVGRKISPNCGLSGSIIFLCYHFKNDRWERGGRGGQGGGATLFFDFLFFFSLTHQKIPGKGQHRGWNSRLTKRG